MGHKQQFTVKVILKQNNIYITTVWQRMNFGNMPKLGLHQISGWHQLWPSEAIASLEWKRNPQMTCLISSTDVQDTAYSPAGERQFYPH